MRPTNTQIRRLVADVTGTAERVMAVSPENPWAPIALRFCRELEALAAEDAPDPDAVDDLGYRYDEAWHEHGAAKSVFFLRAIEAVRKMHVCQWCGHDLRDSPGRCAECGKEPERPPATLPVSLSRLPVAVRQFLRGGGAACILIALILGRHLYNAHQAAPQLAAASDWFPVAGLLAGGIVLLALGLVTPRKDHESKR